MVISAVFCPVFSCILTPLYSECIFVCISMSSECILLYSRERHFFVPATHPPTRFSREYVFRSHILMYSQSLLRIRILCIYRVYSGVFSRYSRIRTEYRRAYLPKFYNFEIRQNTYSVFPNPQNMDLSRSCKERRCVGWVGRGDHVGQWCDSVNFAYFNR